MSMLRVGFKVCMPDRIDYSDEYYGYSLKLKDNKDKDGFRPGIKYEGSIWADKGQYADEKYQIIVKIDFNKPIEATVRTPKGKYEIRFDGGGIFLDVAEALQSVINKFRRVIEEISAAYTEKTPLNPELSVNAIREAEITCPFCGGSPDADNYGSASICTECKKEIMVAWPEMWGIEFTPDAKEL